MRVAILDDYQLVAQRLADWTKLGPDAEIVSFDRHFGSTDEAVSELAGFDVVCGLRERTPFTRELLERLPRLKLIVFTGSRSRAVDVAAAAELGIPVARTGGILPPRPGYSSIVELSFAFILACTRNLCADNRLMHGGAWTSGIGATLRGKKLGLLGFGRVGSSMVPVAEAFGMEVLAWSENLTPERAAAGNATAVSKETLFCESDVISVHLRLSDRTVGLVGAAEFRMMKPSAILVNTARGPIVDEAALIEALSQQRIRAYAADVHHVEPLPADHPLQRLDNAIMTPHIGYLSEKNLSDNYPLMVDQIVAWQRGDALHLFTGDDGTRAG